MLFVRLCVLAGLSALSACGGIQIKPEPALPQALITPLPAKVGLIIAPDMRNYVHKETRWGTDWAIDLGPGHTRFAQDLFRAQFREVEAFQGLDEARQATGLKAIFEPRIEQYSFATARETNGGYYAVTIRYTINLFVPEGMQADSFTLTGYGNALARGISSARPLETATRAAMRDAAAKFLVQFPEQPAAKQLAQNQAITAEKPVTGPQNLDAIEAVPIDEPEKAEPPASAPPAPATLENGSGESDTTPNK